MPNIHDTTASKSRRTDEEYREGLRELALFAGAGGGILGGHLLGWRTICAVEWEPYPASVLIARQNECIFPPFPIWDDVRTFDGKPWRGRVDVVSGGFPCQDISAAGKGAGIDGARSGMWKHMFRVICEVRPRYVFVENSPMLTIRGLGRVLRDLASVGYDAKWCVLGARHVNAPHDRDRIWVRATLADAKGLFSNGSENNPRISTLTKTKTKPRNCSWSQEIPNSHLPQRKGTGFTSRIRAQYTKSLLNSSWWGQDPAETPESGVGRMADGVAARVDRLKAIGNGQVPAVAALAWKILSE